MRKKATRTDLPHSLVSIVGNGEEDIKKFKDSYYTESALLVLRTIRKKLEKDLERLIKECEDDSIYTSPNLQEFLYKKFGERKAIRSALKLLPKTKEEIL